MFFQIGTDEFIIKAVVQMHGGHCVSHRRDQAVRLFLSDVVATFVGLACVSFRQIEAHQLVVEDCLVVALLDFYLFAL